MSVIIDCNWRYWDTKKNSDVVGWPLGSATTSYAYQCITQMCPEFAAAGFSVIRMPPSCQGAAGAYSDGYDLYNHYNIDDTAFGTGEMLRQCVATAHANGMKLWGDLVLHQMGGGPNNTYTYPGANPKIMNGRFPKTPSCFVGPPPGVAGDPVPDSEGNFGFGAMCAYENSTPLGYMHDQTILAAQWLTATVGFDGYRIDDVKGTYNPVVYDLLRAEGIKELFAVGEYFTGNNSELSNWVWGYQDGRASILDFGFHFNVGDICNNSSRAWMGALSSIGYCNVDAFHAVTFIESADTDNSAGEQIIWNKILGYAIMLTFPGVPCVYYRDWADDENCYGLKDQINNLVWIHEHLANGDFVPRLDTDPQVFVHERLGYNGLPGCLCGFNNDQFHEHTVTVQTSYPPNTRLHEYTGHYDTDIWTDYQGNATFTLARNNNGAGYLVFGTWVTGGFDRQPMMTTQTFYGAPDLTTGPAATGTVTVGRVWVSAGSSISATLDVDRAGWTAASKIVFQVVGPSNMVFGTVGAAVNMPVARGVAAVAGFYSLVLTSTALPLTGSDYKFTVEYM